MMLTFPALWMVNVVMTFIRSAYKAIKTTYDAFIAYRSDVLTELYIEPTVASLQDAINAKFGGGFTITDGDFRALTYIYNASESTAPDTFIYTQSEDAIPVYLWQKDTEAGRYRNGISFWVVKQGGYSDSAERDAVLEFVDQFRAAGRIAGVQDGI
ncbi:MAG: hypothetical protein LBR66_04060 [Candidatus Symbiothrix sp.]|nr:hypothetical protein [Candidatus Symbiothrix sp.]